ncbi:MAG: hypothetical protein ACK5M4_10910 [Pseudorhodobacter sp.]
MVTKLSAALTEKLSPPIDLSKSRLETLALLITGMIGARTVNLSHIASERGSPDSAYARPIVVCSGFSSMSHRMRIGPPD